MHIAKFLLFPFCSEDTKSGGIYYFNFRTNESTWDHPCDEFYRKLLMEERKKRSGEGSSKKASKKSSKAKKTAANEARVMCLTLHGCIIHVGKLLLWLKTACLQDIKYNMLIHCSFAHVYTSMCSRTTPLGLAELKIPCTI